MGEHSRRKISTIGYLNLVTVTLGWAKNDIYSLPSILVCWSRPDRKASHRK